MERLHVDLFTGLAGFSLAARDNGVRTIAMCECDKRCRAFLAKAWPGVPIWDDVRTFRLADAKYGGSAPRNTGSIGTSGGVTHGSRQADEHGGNVGPVWILTAGVPCQPASRAGQQRGASDDRWLWEPALAVLADLRPTWALYENPPGIGDVGLAGILSEVGALGYEVRVFGIPACAVGAPHRRERYWIVAHREGGTLGTGLCAADPGRERGRRSGDGDGERMADAGCLGSGQDEPERGSQGRGDTERLPAEHGAGDVDYATISRAGAFRGNAGQEAEESPGGSRERFNTAVPGGSSLWADAVWLPCADGKVRRAPGDSVGLVDGLHRSVLAALGNSIVWPVAAKIIAAMIEAEQP